MTHYICSDTAISLFLMADIFFNIASGELKIAPIDQLNQLFQLLHLVLDIYGYGFYELSRMLMRKNVNNDVSKDSLFWLGFLCAQVSSWICEKMELLKICNFVFNASKSC